MIILDFFYSRWGEIASVVSLVLTIVFAGSAARSSKQAKIAAIQAQKKLQSVDSFMELNRLAGRVDDLLFRLETKSWLIVVERSTDLRVSIATLLTRNDLGLSKSTQARLAEAVTQFKSLASGSDKAIHANTKSPDAARYRRIVNDQKVTLALAIEELKVLIGETK